MAETPQLRMTPQQFETERKKATAKKAAKGTRTTTSSTDAPDMIRFLLERAEFRLGYGSVVRPYADIAWLEADDYKIPPGKEPRPPHLLRKWLTNPVVTTVYDALLKKGLRPDIEPDEWYDNFYVFRVYRE